MPAKRDFDGAVFRRANSSRVKVDGNSSKTRPNRAGLSEADLAVDENDPDNYELQSAKQRTFTVGERLRDLDRSMRSVKSFNESQDVHVAMLRANLSQLDVDVSRVVEDKSTSLADRDRGVESNAIVKHLRSVYSPELDRVACHSTDRRRSPEPLDQTIATTVLDISTAASPGQGRLWRQIYIRLEAELSSLKKDRDRLMEQLQTRDEECRRHARNANDLKEALRQVDMVQVQENHERRQDVLETLNRRFGVQDPRESKDDMYFQILGVEAGEAARMKRLHERDKKEWESERAGLLHRLEALEKQLSTTDQQLRLRASELNLKDRHIKKLQDSMQDVYVRRGPLGRVSSRSSSPGIEDRQPLLPPLQSADFVSELNEFRKFTEDRRARKEKELQGLGRAQSRAFMHFHDITTAAQLFNDLILSKNQRDVLELVLMNARLELDSEHIVDTEKENRVLKQEYSELRGEHRELLEEVENLRAELLVRREQTEEQEILAHKAHRMESVMARAVKLRLENEECSAKLAAEQEMRASLTNELEELKQNYDDIRRQVMSKEEIREMQEELHDAKMTIETDTKLRDEMIAEQIDLKHRLADKSKALESLHKSMRDLLTLQAQAFNVRKEDSGVRTDESCCDAILGALKYHILTEARNVYIGDDAVMSLETQQDSPTLVAVQEAITKLVYLCLKSEGEKVMERAGSYKAMAEMEHAALEAQRTEAAEEPLGAAHARTRPLSPDEFPKQSPRLTPGWTPVTPRSPVREPSPDNEERDSSIDESNSLYEEY
eukprot:Clim_evm7s180 gene=Clim_evmTU7s180